MRLFASFEWYCLTLHDSCQASFWDVSCYFWWCFKNRFFMWTKQTLMRKRLILCFACGTWNGRERNSLFFMLLEIYVCFYLTWFVSHCERGLRMILLCFVKKWSIAIKLSFIFKSSMRTFCFECVCVLSFLRICFSNLALKSSKDLSICCAFAGSNWNHLLCVQLKHLLVHSIWRFRCFGQSVAFSYRVRRDS